MNWKKFLQQEKQKDYYNKIVNFVLEDSKKHTIFPPSKDIFNAFKYCDFDQIKIVILGQDVYHGENQAHGLAFSVLPGIPIPPSLRNIFKEINSDLNTDYKFPNGCLIPWAKQGVLLLNSILTVRKSQPASHAKIGWEEFTDNIIKEINQINRPIVYFLWGNYSKAKQKFITNPKHLVLTSAHPSPFSANNFFGCKHFSQANEFLIKNNIEPINWQLE